MVMARRRRNNKQRPRVNYAVTDIARADPIPANRAGYGHAKALTKAVSPNRRRTANAKEKHDTAKKGSVQKGTPVDAG